MTIRSDLPNRPDIQIISQIDIKDNQNIRNNQNERDKSKNINI